MMANLALTKGFLYLNESITANIFIKQITILEDSLLSLSIHYILKLINFKKFKNFFRNIFLNFYLF